MKLWHGIGLALLTLAARGDESRIYFEDFEAASARQWHGGSGEAGGVGEVSLAEGLGRDDSQALIWRYDLGNRPAGGTYSRCRAMIRLPKRPVRMTLWVCGDGSNLDLQFRILDASGKTWQNGITRIDWEGWKLLEIPIRPAGYCWGGVDRADKGFTYPLTLAEFMLDYSSPEAAAKATRTAGELRFDELSVYEEPLEVEAF